MKKILFILSLVIMSVCAQAQIAKVQQIKTVTKGMLKHEQPMVFGKNHFNSISALNSKKNTGMRKVELAKNERLMGLYTSDEYSEDGIAITNSKGTFQVFSIIPPSYYSRLTEGTITAIRFALSNSCVVKKVFVLGVTADDYIVSISETNTFNKTFEKGWNTVKLAKPCAVAQDVNRLAIGYEYEETPNSYPVSLIDGYSDEGFIFIGDLGQGESVYNGSSEGLLSVQAIVQINNLPATDVALEDMVVASTNVAAGSELQYAFSAYNFGSDDVTSYSVEVKMDGSLVKTVTEKDMAMTKNATYYLGSITLPATISRGTHTLTAELTKVNGKAPENGKTDDKVSTTFSTYMPTDVVTRQKFLIEEMTSHSCTYCPNGAQLLEAMQKQSDALAIVCVHGNQSSKDPFNTEECQSILSYTGTLSFPSATFNRIYYSNEEGITPGIGYSGQHQQIAAEMLSIMESNSIPAFASVDIEHELSADDKTLSIKVSGVGGNEAKDVLKDFALTVYVLEDSLKYRQLNNGTWTSNYIHNHVLRKVATQINGDDIKWTSASSYENTYEVALDETWNRKQLSIIAFISKRQPFSNPNWTDMNVTNANSVRLSNEGGGGNTEDEDDKRVDAGLRITPFTTSTQLMGEGMSLDAKYVAGQNYATYTPCIWNTETGEFKNYAAFEEGTVHAVNSKGTAVGTTVGYGGKALVCHIDGTTETLEDNGGVNTQGADAWCISDDGKTIGGFYYYFEWIDKAQTEGFYATFPCVWQDKKCTTLPYPSKEEMGFNIDGAGLRWMSADGSVMLGYLVDDKATWPAVVWSKNAQGNYVCDPICKNYFEASPKQGKPYMMFNPCGLSSNGEWVALIVQDEFDDSNFNNPIPMPKVARYNLRTKQLEILESDQAFAASAISNEGSVLLYTNIDGLYGRIGYVWKVGESKPTCLDDMLNKAKDMPEFGANVPAAYAADNQTIMGFGIDQDANIFTYVVNLSTLENAINGANGIEDTKAETKALGDGNIYTITGYKVNDMKKPGLYIVNGKKLLVK